MAAARTAGRPRRTRGSKGDGPVAYLFMTPWLIGMAGLTLGPMLASLYLSFTDYNLFTAPEWVGLDNYRQMLADDQFRQASKVTGVYVLLATPLKLGAALAVAMMLVQRRRGIGLYRSAFYAPSLIGASVGVAIVWRALFSDGGVQDSALGAVGLDTGGWIGNPDYSLLMLVLLAIWQFGAPMVIFMAGLMQVPTELYEAAEVDGAGPWRRFRRITVPMISPVIFFNLLLETIHAFQVFASAYVISTGDGRPAGSTLLYTLHLYRRAFTDFRMGYASAMAWTLLVVVGLITVLMFRVSRTRVHYAGEDDR
ncbi:sugar ABC transporter permease [Phytomonospora sp. NPDC050363]|uniref:carbohydrate ABC transporter permease n=1 Tax=Phytomonospora sp. NPDC050363 TaxID=3155642 RepID=UPI0033CB8F38